MVVPLQTSFRSHQSKVNQDQSRVYAWTSHNSNSFDTYEMELGANVRN